jgi:hypothetical protein
MVCYDIRSLLDLALITATAVVAFFFYILLQGDEKQRHWAHECEDPGGHHEAEGCAGDHDQTVRITFVQSVESLALVLVVPLLLCGLREKTITTKGMGYSEEVIKDNPWSTALLPDKSTNIIETPTMPSPPLLMLCIFPAINAAKGYDDETSESNIVVKMHEVPYHCCLMLPNNFACCNLHCHKDWWQKYWYPSEKGQQQRWHHQASKQRRSTNNNGNVGQSNLYNQDNVYVVVTVVDVVHYRVDKDDWRTEEAAIIARTWTTIESIIIVETPLEPPVLIETGF